MRILIVVEFCVSFFIALAVAATGTYAFCHFTKQSSNDPIAVVTSSFFFIGLPVIVAVMAIAAWTAIGALLRGRVSVARDELDALLEASKAGDISIDAARQVFIAHAHGKSTVPRVRKQQEESAWDADDQLFLQICINSAPQLVGMQERD